MIQKVRRNGDGKICLYNSCVLHCHRIVVQERASASYHLSAYFMVRKALLFVVLSLMKRATWCVARFSLFDSTVIMVGK